jgi:hypothetical protein
LSEKSFPDASWFQIGLGWVQKFFRKLFPAADNSPVELEAGIGHPSLKGGFNPLTFIWHYDHVEGCAPDEECWIKVSGRLVTAEGESGPSALLGELATPQEKATRLWEQVLWAHDHGMLEDFNDWIYGCDLLDFERKKWQPGCAFHEVAFSLYKAEIKRR